MDENLQQICKYIDEFQDLYVQRLSECVAIRSVSAWPENRDEVKRVVEVTGQKLREWVKTYMTIY